MSVTNEYIRQVLHHAEPPPTIEARFFYTSPLAIDDPLSPLPPPSTSTTPASRQPPRPFAEYDSTALDKAWNELRRKILQYHEERGEKLSGPEDEDEEVEADAGRGISQQIRGASDSAARMKTQNVGLGSGKGRSRASSAVESRNVHPEDKFGRTNIGTSLQALDGPMLPVDVDASATTGTPFLRAPSRRIVDTPRSQKDPSRSTRPGARAFDSYKWDDIDGLQDMDADEVRSGATTPTGPSAKVPVGVSRLHHVVMPDLKMEPIYWSPVHDISAIVRGTWFYKDTMLPVETPVANMLEAGYVELRPWTETWNDELNSAVDVGAAGEMKILRPLWPRRGRQSSEGRPSTARGEMASILASRYVRTCTASSTHKLTSYSMIDQEPDTPEQERARDVENACDLIDISIGPDGSDNKAAGSVTYGRHGPIRMYAMSGVIYANAIEAHILKPNLQPSTYYGRRPLANYIRKGHKLGIPVVRGFDQAAWDALYPQKKSATADKADEGVSASQSGASPLRRQKTDPALSRSLRPKVTDLVLVVHGIGQKLSERMESFHFTHAINSFRREVNVELGSKSVKSNLRADGGGIMVLPVSVAPLAHAFI